MRRLFLAWVTLLTLVLAQAANAAEWPSRPIHIVVPYAPGGSTDILARLLADRLQSALGQSVVVDNKGGAGSILGTEYVAQSAPDGYTVLLASSAHTVNPVIYHKIGYDPIEGFAPVTLLVTIPHVLVVNASLPVHSIAELITYARATPGGIKFGSAGIGTSNQIEAELLAKRADVKAIHVAYRGIGPALTDLMAGRLDMIMGSLPSLMPTTKTGKIRAIAVTAKDRVPTAPELPTIAESGLPGFETIDWLGLLFPAKTDPAIVNQLQRACAVILADPAFKARLDELGFVSAATTAEQFSARLRNDVWATTARDAGIRIPK